jgi:carbonic anhydrase
MNRMVAVKSREDIFPEYRNTPIESLLLYHNLKAPFETYYNAEIIIGMCMDNRKQLKIPDNFAYIIRAGGANLRYSEFIVSYSMAVGGVRALALIVHNQCGMVNVMSKKDAFINGLVENVGWKRERAEEHFHHYAPMFEIENETEFALNEVKRLRVRYPKILVAPMLYRIEDNYLYLLEE